MKAFGVCSSNGQAGTKGVRLVGAPTAGECFRGGVASILSVSANRIVQQYTIIFMSVLVFVGT